ncbi:MAG: SDR family NAD(P)-dependent oxidoreductase [Candidatus Nanopelagicales bacterium]
MTRTAAATWPHPGDRVLVTGAAGGFGARICALLADAGADVVASDLTADSLAGVPGTPLPLDVTDAAGVESAVAGLGPLDGLVLSHGITALGPATEVPRKAVERVLEINLTGAVRVTLAALPGLVARRGRIGVLSSVAGYAPLVDRTAYAASKHALHGYFDSLRAELVDDGVSVTLVAPSFAATGIESRAAFRAAGEGGDWSTTGDVLTPDEVARAVVDGMARRRRLVLVSRTARLAWWVSRVAPARYEAMMRRRIRGS